MTDENNTTDTGDTTTTSTNDNPEITMDSVIEVAPEALNDDQKAFLLDNAGELTDEQRETYKDVLEGGEKKEEKIDPDKVEIKVRGELPKEKEPEKGDEDEEEIDPEDKKNIGKVVDEKLTDFRGTQTEVQRIKDQQEVNDYVADHQEFQPYKGVMLKHMAHPAYKNIPIDSIAAIVAAADLQKLGAKKEREAAAKAKSTQDTGSPARTQKSGDTDWGSASKEAFLKKKNEVLGIKS